MKNIKNITAEVWDIVEAEKTKISDRFLDNVLNRDKINVIQSGDVFWIEQTHPYSVIPRYGYTYLISLLKRTKGLRYLHGDCPE